MDVFTDAVVTPCAHIFCRECLGEGFDIIDLDQSDD